LLLRLFCINFAVSGRRTWFVVTDTLMLQPITDPTWIFFVVLSIILFAPMVLERLRVPSIVGMIFAGVLVGPYGLHVLDRDSSFELFGKVGIYYIMFLASLEMNMQELNKIQGKALGFGLLSFAFPFALGFGANLGLLGCTVMASVLMAAMYASHTLISYPIVLRYGLARRASVNMAVGGTIVADTLTLLVLAVVGDTFKAEVNNWFWLLLMAKLMAICAAIIFLFPRFTRFFFKRYNDGVVQYVFVMVLVFLGAGLMEFVGMEGILGAFLVGIVLNKQIPATSPLMNHIEFIGNALFIPYFLIGVGMLVNVQALMDLEALEVAAVMIGVGMLGKWLAAYSARRLYALSACDGRLMFGLSNSRAAATLAIVLVGYSIVLPDGSRLLGESVLNGAMILILVSCVVSSFVTERAARQLVSEHEAEETPASLQQEDRIVMALNNPDTVDALVNAALMLRTPKSLHPLSAINIVIEGNENTRKQGRELLERAARISAAANVRMQTHSRWSVNVVSGISHAMKELDASDLIVGLHHREKLFEPFYGKIAMALFEAVDRQIIVYRATSPISTIRRLHVVVPKRAELEPNYGLWADRVALMAAQLSCRIDFYGVPRTLDALQKHYAARHPALHTDFHHYDSWGDFFPLAEATRQDHMVIFVVARPGTISYHHYFSRLTDQMERYFSTRSLMVIYPAQYRGTIGKTSVLVTK